MGNIVFISQTDQFKTSVTQSKVNILTLKVLSTNQAGIDINVR